MDGVKKKKIITITIFALTVVLGVTALIITWRLQQKEPVAEPEAEAASEEVTDADTLKSETQRQIFASLWKEFASDKTHTWEDYVNYAMGEGARYDCDTEIMTVGEEKLYGCDLNVYFIMYELPTYTSSEEIKPDNTKLNNVLDKLITASGLLQKASELDLITLTEDFFNYEKKDMNKRLSTVKQVREMLEENYIKKIDFEAISIYFRNETNPPYTTEDGYTLEEAQAIAKAKMDVLYERLNNSEITMEEAGAEIIADNISGDTTGISLSRLDPIYKENAYLKIKGHEFGEQIFNDERYDEELKSLGEGQYSTVRLFKDYVYEEEDESTAFPDSREMEDSCYVIFKVNNIYFNESSLTSDSMEELESIVLQEYQR